MDPMHLPNLAGLLPDPVVVVGPDASITWANAAAERIFGIPLEDVVGTSGLDLVHPDDLEFVVISMDTVQDKARRQPDRDPHPRRRRMAIGRARRRPHR